MTLKVFSFLIFLILMYFDPIKQRSIDNSKSFKDEFPFHKFLHGFAQNYIVGKHK
jgi:hypothetical protein